MQSRSRIILLVFFVIMVVVLTGFSRYIEGHLFHLFDFQAHQDTTTAATIFYAIVNINVILAFLFLFLTFRNGVKLTLDRKRGVFGSSLRTRLVMAFLFFSLLPTIVLLYISTKFVNAKFEGLENIPLAANLSASSPGQIFLLSYYVMLGAVTMLIIFSATWLGFTLARELTGPLQILATATEMVAQGSYSVQIDDIVAQDEMGRLARSFRSMVSDLREAKEKADKAYDEIQNKSFALAEKSEYNSILLQNIHAAVISFTEHGIIESWNMEAERLFRFAAQEAIGKNLRDAVPHPFFTNILEPLLSEAYLFDKKSAACEFSGQLFKPEVELQVYVNHILTKQRVGTVLIIYDVTAFAKAQRLAAWREIARRVAHEIKNPLTPIKLGAQRLEKKFKRSIPEADVGEFSESVQVILHSADLIKSLVDEFVRIAKMPNPVFREANILDTIRLAVASFKENSEGIKVQIDVEDSLKILTARFDPEHMLRLFVNLIANAVAASSSKKTPVFVKIEPHLSRKMLVVKVVDSGVGIPNALKSKIFEPYFSTKRTGTGLGLVIVRQILEEHHGSISLEQNLPQGSVFVVELPLYST